ncbi:DsbA family protein [uncultured Umboniibacter sp.]|uniref:DsbA family protein n=1 Tax=uncultured Umboniibacter sp. TaxID=1798917 RepID=UPI002634715C|nr:DsbA family protein [uncultured Umboniibacter sp.]
MSKVTQQRGASSSSPSPFKRWLTSKIMTYLGGEQRLLKVRKRREAKRIKEGRRHVIEYFHQVDDGYSHLALQLLEKFKAHYDVEFIIHLVPALRDDNFPEPELWQEMSRADAQRIAAHYGLTFNCAESLPPPNLVAKASCILSHLSTEDFYTKGLLVSECLWRCDEAALDNFAEQLGTASKQQVTHQLDLGSARRKALKHYSSATFWYEGEWYWGVDRSYHLEQRLISLAAQNQLHDNSIIAPRPEIETNFPTKANQLTLEFFASLRSPYTAMIWDATFKLAEDSGVKLVVRPVLPMVMRGVPATLEKGLYLATDVAREARTVGADYGNFYDPIGTPVLQAYSLYMWALTQDKGNELLTAFLKAAFARGINTNRQSGLRKVVESAGLTWSEAKQHLHDDDWKDLLEGNRLAMYQFGSWGVPSYRLLDASGQQIMGVWGQDRLWLVAKKISELLD